MEDVKMYQNQAVRGIFRMIDDSQKEAIDSFCCQYETKCYSRLDDLGQMMIDTVSLMNSEDLDIIRTYSGYNFRNMNNVLRDKWNYDENGHEKNKEKFRLMASKMVDLIKRNPSSIGNALAFRGVSIDYFKDYGIDSLEELEKLEGKFLVDKGFVSTSLNEDSCFYKKENDLGMNYNVKLVYMIPDVFDDGIYIGNKMASYNPDQCEYIINSWNMAKVVSVKVEDDSAVVGALLIPKKVYDDYYSNEKGNVK